MKKSIIFLIFLYILVLGFIKIKLSQGYLLKNSQQNSQNLIIDYYPKPLTAGIFPEILGEPFTLIIKDINNIPIDLSEGGKFSDEYILENCFIEKDQNVGFGKWKRKSIKDKDLLIDFSQKEKGIYRFYGFVANDKGKFEIEVLSANKNLTGKVEIDVELPKAKFLIINLENPNVNFICSNENDFKLTAGDLRIYQIKVKIYDVNGKEVKSSNINELIKVNNLYLKYFVFYIPFVSFTPKYNLFLITYDELKRDEIVRDFGVYQNTNFNAGLFYKNKVPLRGGMYNFNYNYDKWNWGKMFADINMDKIIDYKDLFIVDNYGECEFKVIITDIGVLSGMIGSYIEIFKDESSIKNSFLKSFDTLKDISGNENYEPDGVIKIDYFSHIQNKVYIDFLKIKLYKNYLNIYQEEIIEELSKEDIFDPDNYDLIYGINNKIIIELFPVYEGDLPVKNKIYYDIIGIIKIWNYGNFIYNPQKLTSEAHINVKPIDTGNKISYLSLMCIYDSDNGINKIVDKYFEKIIPSGSLYFYYSVVDPDFELKNREIENLKHYPKLGPPNINCPWPLPFFDSGRGLQININKNIIKNRANELIIKVVDISLELPINEAKVYLINTEIELETITDKDGIAKIKVTPIDFEDIKIIVKKEGYFPFKDKLKILENDIKLTKPELVEIKQIDKGIEIKWFYQEEKIKDIKGIEIWRKVNESLFQLIKILEFYQNSYVDENVKYGETYIYKIRVFDNSTPLNYSDFSNLKEITFKDNIPPTIEILYPKDKKYFNEEIINIKGYVYDNESGLDKIFINEEEINIKNKGEFEKSIILINNENLIKISAIDKFNNRKDIFLNLYLDKIKPELIVDIPNKTNINYITINGKLKDNFSGIDKLIINNQNVTFLSDNTFIYSIYLNEGLNLITFEVYDRAGNVLKRTFEILFEKKIIIKLIIGSKTIFINDLPQEIDVSPKVIEGRTYLPIRYIVEPIGAKLNWIPNERKITISLKEKVIELWIGKNKGRVNGVEIPIDPNNPKVVPLIISGRTMLPVRFVAENLGCKVEWDALTKTIIIIYPYE